MSDCEVELSGIHVLIIEFWISFVTYFKAIQDGLEWYTNPNGKTFISKKKKIFKVLGRKKMKINYSILCKINKI